MNYDNYRIFYFAGKHLNFTKAAQELYTSQPAVTRAIQNLEHELGCKLFLRSHKGLTFTHEGKQLYEYAESAFKQLAKGEDEVTRSVNVDGGTIYIGASATALYDYLFKAINRFQSRYPNIKFKIRTGSNNGTVARLADGTVDLAFVSTPCNISKALSATVIKTFSDILVGGSAFMQLKDLTLNLEDIASYPYICLRKGMQLREFIDSAFAAEGLAVEPAVEADASNLLIPMITHNLGIGFVPQSMAHEAIERGEVFPIKLRKELPPRKIIMLSSSAHPKTNASREFLKMVKSEL